MNKFSKIIIICLGLSVALPQSWGANLGLSVLQTKLVGLRQTLSDVQKELGGLGKNLTTLHGSLKKLSGNTIEFNFSLDAKPSLNVQKAIDEIKDALLKESNYSVSLDLTGQSNLHDSEINNIIDACKQKISELKLRQCNGLFNPTRLLKNERLEVLDISGCRNITTIYGLQRLTSLKKLNASGCQKLDSSKKAIWFFMDHPIIEQLPPNIEQLALDSWWYLRNSDIKTICEKFKKLEIISLVGSDLAKLTVLNLISWPAITKDLGHSVLSKWRWLTSEEVQKFQGNSSSLVLIKINSGLDKKIKTLK